MKVLIHGIGGRMGNHVATLAKTGYRGAVPAVGVDPMEKGEVLGIPCVTSLKEVNTPIDVIVDFSHHSVTKNLLDYAVEHRIPTVVCTTGHTDEEIALIHKASESIPVFYSYNMSLGVALLVELAKKTAETMPEAEIEIVETHHNRKLDAPSGTALMIANALLSVRKTAKLIFGRSGQGKRAKEDIGMHSIRIGNVVGIHEVIIGTDSQTITLKHEAHDRGLFAEGALAAAEFLVKQGAGLYDMNAMLAEGNKQ